MKKNVIISVIATFALALGIILYFDYQKEYVNIPQNEPESGEESMNSDNIIENSKIHLLIQNEEVIVELNNSEASTQFLNMLPLTLTFEDYNNVEKISYLDDKLDTTNSPDGYDPEIGDFSYYVPWGNLSIFYKDFRYSNSLVKLGTIVSGIDIIENMTSDFEVTIEKMEG